MVTVAGLAHLEAQSKTRKNSLSLDGFISQVAEKNPALRAAEASTEGAGLRSNEGELLTSPTLKLSAQAINDQKQSATPGFTGTKSLYEVYSASIEQQTSFGLSGKIKYDFNFKGTEGSSPTVNPVPTYFTGSPGIELTQSFWRNGFGKEIRSNRDALNNAARAIQYGKRFEKANLLLEAEVTYWRLHYARKTIEALRESIVLAERFRDWASRRASLQLGDQSDFLQAKAALETRQLELLKSLEEEKAAARAFNSLRGIEGVQVDEGTVEPAGLAQVNPSLAPNLRRDDLRASEAQARATEASALASREKYKPSLDLVGTYAFNALNTDGQKAREESFKSDYPTYSVGLRFSTPLDLGNASDTREGYAREAEASQLVFQRKLQEHQRDLEDLRSQIRNASERLVLAQTVEKSQKDKLAAERNRLNRGRTTTAQVILFEQDYILAQITRIRTESELLGYLAKAKLFREE